MKTRVLCHYENGEPEKVLRLEERELPPLAENQVLVKVKAAPINPADINVLQGKYPVKSALPRVLGNEGTGEIAALGGKVKNISLGQQVITLASPGWWCDYFIAQAGEVFPVARKIDWLQAAMLSVNPPTAWRMLTDFADLKSGDWLAQNAANSAVGRLVIQLARSRGIKTLNIVRRPELAAELKALGAHEVLTEEIPFAKKVKEVLRGAPLPLALNAVGGESAKELSKSLSHGGTLVTYGAMGMKPLEVSNALLIFNDVRFRGFWISQWYRQAAPGEISAMLDQLSGLFADKQLIIPVEKTYPLEQAQAALAHARQEGRGGKVLFEMK